MRQRPAPELNGSPRVGGIRPLRFLAVTGPAVTACLAVVAGIVLGYVPVAIAAARPIDLRTRAGTADELQLAIGTDRSVTGLASTDSARPVGLVDLRDGDLEDLCLLPRFDLPVVGQLLTLRIVSPGRVRIGEVTLAANGGTAGRLAVTNAIVGGSAGDRPGAIGGPGSFAVESEGPEAVRLGGVDLTTYGLVLQDGIRLTSLTIHPALGDQHC